jgi:hypothetical protein
MTNTFSFLKSSIFPIMLIFCLTSSLGAQSLPTETSNLFSGAGNCAQCHIAGNGAFTTQTGTDISPTTLWRSTMMANAARDPLWQAKVTAEVAEHPALQTVIEDKCTTCHAPMGRTEAIYNGADHFSLDEAFADALSMDGVSCTLCHQIQKNNLGTEESFSGKYEVMNVHDIFGPYISPTAMPMFNQTGYTPVYSDHVNNSELCATCHTLFTPYVDNQGQVAGYFPEQTPYLEWKNSIYPDESTECQTCHTPALNEAMKISMSPPWLSTQRSPIWEHDFVGGNVFMNTILKIHGAEIGVTASEAHFDSTISKTTRLLQEQTVDLSAEANISGDTLNVNVLIENLSGHKFPTGFPSRRAWLHVVVKNRDNETVFESGNWNSNGEISGLDQGFEPHHQLISEPDQVQIYQAVMKDVDDAVTYTLLRGAEYAKDNRLPPKGFKTAVPDYESIAIIGAAADDPDFNRNETRQEGSGSDQVFYKCSIAGKGTEFNILIDMYYQTISPRFAQDLLSHQTDEVAKFKGFYDNAEKAPILIKTISLAATNTGVKENGKTTPKSFGLLKNYPNPFNASTIIQYEIEKPGFVNLVIFDVLGKKVKTMVSKDHNAGNYQIHWDGTDESGNSIPSGIYFALLTSKSENNMLRLLLLK